VVQQHAAETACGMVAKCLYGVHFAAFGVAGTAGMRCRIGNGYWLRIAVFIAQPGAALRSTWCELHVCVVACLHTLWKHVEAAVLFACACLLCLRSWCVSSLWLLVSTQGVIGLGHMMRGLGMGGAKGFADAGSLRLLGLGSGYMFYAHPGFWSLGCRVRLSKPV
jgi:hypothetical protein